MHIGLVRAARERVATMESSLTARELLRRYGRVVGRCSMVVCKRVSTMTKMPGIEILLDMIVDDGKLDRHNRRAIFESEFNYVGLCTNKIRGITVCAILFAQDFEL